MEFDLTELSSISSATRAFVLADERMVALTGQNHPYFSADRAIAAKNDFPADARMCLSKHLNAQYERLIGTAETHESVVSNINALENPDTYTVSTGQQLHLFLGPAFVLYKIMAVIRMTEDLKLKHPDKHFVPVYWLASEDHDIDEIRDTVVFGRNFRWNTDQTGACGRFHVREVAGLIEQIRTELSLNENNKALLNAFEVIYSTSETLADASIRLVNHLFGQYGLICLDADHSEFKSSIIPFIKKDVLDNANIEPFTAMSDLMAQNGYSTQLSGRDINFFYLQPGQRNRIVNENGVYKVQNTEISFSNSEMAEDIERHPERFSPNAMLRPLYQESILPNVAYIGGNAEVNYWLQISNVFKVNNINPPNLCLRPSVWIIPHKTGTWLNKSAIDPLKMLITANSENLLGFLNPGAEGIEALLADFTKLKKEAQDIAAQSNNKELHALAEAGKHYEKLLKSLNKHVIQTEKDKLQDKYQKLEEIYRIYFNIKEMQERKLNTLELLIKHENVAFRLKNDCKLQVGKGYLMTL